MNIDIVIATRILLIAYAAVMIFFVVRGALRTRSMTDFAIGNGFSPLVVGLSLAANITSAATFIINPGFVAMFGLSAFIAMSVMVPLGLMISLIILSRSFQKYGSAFKAISLAQWVNKRYNSPAYGRLMAVLSLLLITFIVLICVGMVKVIAPALQASELYVLIGLVVFVFGYTMFGGANSMAYTNAFQAIVMGVVALILIFSGTGHFDGGLSAFWGKLNQIDPMLSKTFNPTSPIFRDFFEVIFCNFIIGLAIVCQPHIITRSLMLRSSKDINKYLAIAIVVEMLFFMVLFVGLFARLDMPDLTLAGKKLPMDGIMSAYVLERFDTGVGLLVIFGLLSAGLSTLEGLVQSVSTTVTNDIILPSFKSEISEDRKKLINRAVITLLGVIAITVSYRQLVSPNLSVAILGQNGVYAFFSAAFMPVLLGIFTKNIHKLVPIASTIVAVIVYFATYYGELSFYTTGIVRNPAVAGTYAIFGAILAAGIMYFITRNKTNINSQKIINA